MTFRLAQTTIHTIVTTEEAAHAPGKPEESRYDAYFAGLHGLLKDVLVQNGSGQRLQPEEGMKEAISLVLGAHFASSAKVMIVGNGGSAAIASHQALDLWKSCGIRAMAFNDAAQLTCLGNDFGYEHVFSKAIEMFGQQGDLLIAISSSGSSQNILNAVKAAREKSLRVITFAGFNKFAPLISEGDLNFYVDSNQYGLVEVAHMAIIHQLTDRLSETLKEASR